MAKQKGMIPFVGTMGGINFYYLNGTPVARRAGGGFNGKAIQTKASMQRVRENASEFGQCSRVNKVFRRALSSFYIGHRFTYLHSRVLGLFTQLKHLDSLHARGQRRVAVGVKTLEGTQLLKQFCFTPDCDVRRMLPFQFNMDADTFVLTLKGFDITRVGFVAGATHIKLSYGVLDFNFETLAFGLHLASPMILGTEALVPPIILTPESLPKGVGMPLGVLAIRFYQKTADGLYELQTQDAVGFMLV
ncbi:hypothetical protein QLS71_012275 [Mariniflexile litorale]|uniref:Uncharacterized protein n=1 Tax=Mariniflexile litorale TaxID=3045158 RepID=A0AAU7EE29_9FLAO|nr:hypothetical protein [Mariniflexile sp. KMM 9835]MDQ8213440.1 hypothetical protein [Mariniflexile sp. KMM 9835]